MICARCGQVEVEIGATCHRCGAVAVAPDVLDSVLSLPAEPVPEVLDDEPATFQPLPVDPGAPVEVVGPSSDRPDPPPLSVQDAPAPPPPVASAPEPAPGPPLPRRTPIDATAPQWGPRQHPPAVLAPPPPHPLDAPPARVKRPQGTGLPSGLAGAAAASSPARPAVPGPPPAPAAVPAEPLSVPDRPSHPRVRRWFGRGGADDEVSAVPEPAAEPVEAVLDGPFAGAPAGLLDGVRPEPDVGSGVRDPAGLEAAMSRMSSGARRGALAPLGVVAALLEPGEVAEAVVQGQYQHRPGVVVLTDRRVVIANDRRWAPDVRTFGFDPALVVHGWQDERRATLVFVLDGVGTEVEGISDRPLARDLAQRIRGRCAGEPSMGG